MFIDIIKGAPIWVWPLLALLIFFGYQASKDRRVPIVIICLLPLLGIISLRSIGSLPNPVFAWTSYGIGYALGSAFGYVKQASWIIAREDKMITLKGEWITMLTMMVVFWMNFASGVTKEISPQTFASDEFTVISTLVAGIVGGIFLGRAIRVVRA